jgi:hypothetical protein
MTAWKWGVLHCHTLPISVFPCVQGIGAASILFVSVGAASQVLVFGERQVRVPKNADVQETPIFVREVPCDVDEQNSEGFLVDTQTEKEQRGPGRPASGGPIVSVSCDGRGIAWCDGVFQGDRALVKSSTQIAMWEWDVKIHPLAPLVKAGSETPIGAAAAMLGACGGRGVIVDAPDSVVALFPQDDKVDIVIGTPVIDEEEAYTTESQGDE